MKLISIFIALTVFSLLDCMVDGTFHRLWRLWKKKYNKHYSFIQDKIRYKIWKSNVLFINRHNLEFDIGLQTYWVGLNPYTDMTNKEFAKSMHGFIPPLENGHNENNSIFTYDPNITIAESCDWRKAMPGCAKVQNQDSCASCYAFSAVTAIECAYEKKYRRYVGLSKQEIVDCSTWAGNYGCEGGLMTTVYTYVKQSPGINAENVYPYEGKMGACRHNRHEYRAEITSYAVIPYKNEQALMQAVSGVCVVSAAVDASSRSFMMYKGGIYADPRCTDRPSHAIAIFGYDSENGIDYYIVKNSWGEFWGENGYFRLQRGNNLCGIANMASYPIL